MIKGYPGSLYGNYRTKTFSEVYPDKDSFVNEYNDIGIPTTISSTDAGLVYYLLYSRFANSHIASSDMTRFKYNLFSKIWQFGPTWIKKLDIQARLRELTEEEMLEGSRQIYNAAQNPSTDPSNFSEEELQYINSQNVTKARKGKLDGYAVLMGLLEVDVTEAFLTRFKDLFLTIVMPELPLWYENEDEEGDK